MYVLDRGVFCKVEKHLIDPGADWDDETVWEGEDQNE